MAIAQVCPSDHCQSAAYCTGPEAKTVGILAVGGGTRDGRGKSTLITHRKGQEEFIGQAVCVFRSVNPSFGEC